MPETERLSVEVITELQKEVATQREVTCNLISMNDELEAKLDKIKQVYQQWSETGDNADSWAFKQIREILENK